MSKNPFVNALVASGYISLLATAVFTLPRYVTDNELGLMAPMLFLSLFVFSAAVMGYLFLYEPLRLLLADKQTEATKLFLTTVFTFACITIVIFLFWLLLRTAL